MNEEFDKTMWEEYLIPGTDTLKNNFNITDKAELKEKEKLEVRKTLAKIYLKPVKGNFDMNHLLEIHKNIFSSIYPFAGVLRKCTMQKNTVFCDPTEIENQLQVTLDEMNKEFECNIYSIEEFAFKLARYYYTLIYIHPLREGNGRSIRVFILSLIHI